MVPERRSAARYPLAFPALLKWPARNAGTRIIELQTSDISACGVFFKTRIRLPLDSRVSVDLISQPQPPLITIDGRESTFISIPGRIVRQNRAGLAVAFDHEYRVSAIRDRLAALRKELHWIHRHQHTRGAGKLSIVS